MPDRHSELDSARHEPAVAEVKAALERVLESRCFAQSDRAKEFLRFVVTESIAGRADRLKGYTIGLQVFGRPPDFDAQTDPLVRVEARRVRSRLLEYYSGEGARDPVRIDLPRGGYAPRFAHAPAQDTAPRDGAPPTPQLARGRRIRFAAIGVSAVAAALAAWVLSTQWRGDAPAPPPRAATAEAAAPSPVPPAPRRPTVLLPTFANLSGAGDLDYFSYGITEDVATNLGALGVLVIRGSGDASASTTAPPSSTADYLLTGTVRPAPDRIRVSARVVVAATGAQLWGEAYDEPADVATLLSIQQRIAERVSMAIAQPFGPIFRAEALAAARKPAEYLDTYDCVLRYRYYRRNIDARGHGQSLECFRRAVAREPRYADAWAGLALVYLDEHLYGYDPQGGVPDALSRAHETARAALDVDGGNSLANLAMARVRFALGDMAGFERAAERVESSNPSNPDDLMTVGMLFGVAGNWDRGLPLIDKAYALSGSENTGMLSTGYAVHGLQTGNYDEALRYALRLDAPRWYVATVVVVVAASLAERPDIAHRAAVQLLEQAPDFSRTARTQIAKWHMNDELFEKFIRGLNGAGIETP